MEQSVQELCWLLQEILFKKQKDFKISDPERLYTIAKEGGLSGTVFEVVKKHSSDNKVIKKFQRDFYKYIAQDEEQRSVLLLLEEMLKRNDISYVHLKGSALKDLYPQSFMRSMGDIDILVNPRDAHLVEQLLFENAFKLYARGSVHNVYLSPSNTPVEVHKRLVKEKDGEFLDLENFSKSLKMGELSTEIDLTYLIYHLRKHLITSGIGIRSVIDIGIYVHKNKNSIQKDKLYSTLERCDLLQLFRNILSYNEKYLELDFSWIEEDVATNDDLFQIFTEYIVESGVHGVGVSFNQFTGIIASNNTKGLRRISTILKIVFLPYHQLKYIYPKLLRYKVFLPFAWVKRIYTLVFKRTKRTFGKTVKLFDNKMGIEKTKNMFEELGL